MKAAGPVRGRERERETVGRLAGLFDFMSRTRSGRQLYAGHVWCADKYINNWAGGAGRGVQGETGLLSSLLSSAHRTRL